MWVEWKGGRELNDNLSERPSDIPKEHFNEILPDILNESETTNEKLIMIINRQSGLAPYSHEFTKGNLDPQIISGFISAMTSFMGAMTGDLQKHWKTEYGSGLILLVEYGTWAIGVIVVSRETTEVRSRINRVVREFEDCFAVLRDSDGIEGSALRDFDQCVRKAFVNEQITGRTMVIKRPEWRISLPAFNLPSTAFAISKVLLGFEERTTVKEIAELHGLTIDDTIDLVSQAYWREAVLLKYVPPDDEILILSEKSSALIFQRDNPLGLSDTSLNIIAHFDGRTSLSELTEYVNPQDMGALLDELGTLANRGFIQRISHEQRQVLFNESFLSSLIFEGSSIIGSKRMKQIFESIRGSLGNHNPRIYRITLTEKMHVRCIIDENMSLDDLNNLASVLELFIDELSTQLSRICGKNVIERLFLKARRYVKNSGSRSDLRRTFATNS